VDASGPASSGLFFCDECFAMSEAPMQIAEFQKLIRDRYYATDSARGAPATSAGRSTASTSRSAKA
jgi:hypothetical protein